MAWRSPTTLESPLVYAYELWVCTSCLALQGSIVSYAGVSPIFQELSCALLELLELAKKKKEHIHTPGSTNRHTHSALMAPPNSEL